MKVLIIGFDNYNELDNTMNKLIEDSGCYLFEVICGGLSSQNNSISLAQQWAEKNGAPICWCICKNADELTKKLSKETDYIIIKITDKTPQFWKNFMLKLKQEGKHGTIVR